MFDLSDNNSSNNLAIELLPPVKVARRAFCLATLVTRAEIEMALRATPASQLNEITQGTHRQLSRKMFQWLEGETLSWELSPRERALLAKPPGSWDEGESLRAVWRQESLAALLWALGLVRNFPAPDELIDQDKLLALLPLNKPTAASIEQAKLRPPQEIAEARQRAETWHWRARTWEMAADPLNYPPPAGSNYATIIAIAAEMGELNGYFKRIGGDFPAKGKPYKELTEEEWGIINGIAIERHYALNWLCGWSDDWDHVPIPV
jgi:hypothetical protein